MKIMTTVKTLIFILVLSSIFIGNAQADCSDVILSDEDISVFKRIDEIEKSANSVSRLLAWAPIINVVTAGSAIESALTAINEASGLATVGEAIGAMEKIKVCKIAETIELHMIELNGCRESLFEKVLEPYKQRC